MKISFLNKYLQLAQPIRLLLEYAGADYKDVQYACGPAPKFDLSPWLDVKNTLGLDYPNLPYLIDGHIKITQSNAILRYLGRKFDLDGKAEEDRVQVDIMLDNAMDFRNGFVGLCYNPDFATLKKEYLAKLDVTLKKFSDHLGNRSFFAANYVTYPDFHMYEMLDSHRLLAPEVVNKYANLVAFIERFEKLPKIGAFLKTAKGSRPMNNKMAKFGQAKL